MRKIKAFAILVVIALGVMVETLLRGNRARPAARRATVG